MGKPGEYHRRIMSAFRRADAIGDGHEMTAEALGIRDDYSLKLLAKMVAQGTIVQKSDKYFLLEKYRKSPWQRIFERD